jgi:hypothetical protein
MPGRFEALARYNAETWRGIVHAPEFTARMAALKVEYDEWVHQQTLDKGYAEEAPGIYVRKR